MGRTNRPAPMWAVMPTLAPACRRRSERGAVFLEFAVILPLLLALILGIFTGGQAYSEKIAVMEAVREGARYGASLPMGSGAGALTAWETGVRNRVVDASGGEVALADVCVAWVLPSSTVHCGLSDPAGASNEPSVHLVKVSASKAATMQFFFFSKSTTLTGRLVARFERDTG
jgi:Flp pilus assembly protein TadG